MNWKLWWKAAGVRAVKTAAQTAVSTLTLGPVIGLFEADWPAVVSVSLMAGVMSLLTSLGGLPEVDG